LAIGTFPATIRFIRTSEPILRYPRRARGDEVGHPVTLGRESQKRRGSIHPSVDDSQKNRRCACIVIHSGTDLPSCMKDTHDRVIKLD
jgi:hypothetical protein